MSRLGLRGRLTLASVLVLGLALAVISVVGNLLLASSLTADARAVLRDRASAQLSSIDTDGGRLEPSEKVRDGALGQATWIYSDGYAELRGVAGPKVQRAADELANTAARQSVEVGESVRLLAVPAYANNGRRRIGTVVVGIALGPYERTEHLAVIGTILLDCLVLLFTALLARRVVGAALRPVADMTSRAAEWSANDLHRRFALGRPHDELTSLAATLDGLLGRLDAALRHEQRFSAEMAHELRTPLAGLRMEAELALRDGQADEDRKEALRRVLAGTDRMAGVIETLLSTAKTGTATVRSRCDALLAVTEAVEAVRPGAGAHDVALDLDAPDGPAPVLVSHQVVAQALHPVLENAVRHARSRVGVSLTTGEDEQLVVAVTDDGPGLNGLEPEAAFRPGASTTGGAGLGLPLARRLARSGGGDVVVAPVAEGARFELRLPTARH
jgi:signal transduction histidine kinase